MALYVDYKVVMGELTEIQNHDGKDFKYKYKLYRANCLGALVYLYKNEEGEEMGRLMCFLSDKQHLKNMLNSFTKDHKYFDRVKSIKLNLYYKECQDWLTFFVRQGYHVECYIEEPKNK